MEIKPQTSNIFIARQPIFTRSQKVFGYELLFRSSLANYFDPLQDGERATSRVITDTFLLFGIPRLTDSKKAFINFTGDMLVKEVAALFPKEITMVEILENIQVTPQVVDACQELVRKGYQLALDDFQYSPAWDPLLKLAHIVKFDFRKTGPAELKSEIEAISKFKVKLLAEKVETLEEFQSAQELGFDYFQGYFFRKPKIIEGRDIPGSKLTHLQVLRELQQENYDFSKVSELISRDVSLSFKLLKYVNSAYFSRPQAIQSVQSAIALLGELNLRKWLSLMMLSYLAEDKPSELLRLSIQRAAFCEMLARRLPAARKQAHLFFTAGMFSLLDALLDQPMDTVLHELSLAGDLRAALLGEGVSLVAKILYLVKLYEHGSWQKAIQLARHLGLESVDLPNHYLKAIEAVRPYDIE